MSKELISHDALMDSLLKTPDNVNLFQIYKEFLQDESKPHRYNAVISAAVYAKLEEITQEAPWLSIRDILRRSLKMTMIIDCHNFINEVYKKPTPIFVGDVPIQIDSIEDEFDLSEKTRYPLAISSHEFNLGRSIANMVDLSFNQYVERSAWFGVAFDEARKQLELTDNDPLPFKIGDTSYLII